MLNPGLQDAAHWLFAWKNDYFSGVDSAVHFGVPSVLSLYLSVGSHSWMGLNPISFQRFTIDRDACTSSKPSEGLQTGH